MYFQRRPPPWVSHLLVSEFCSVFYISVHPPSSTHLRLFPLPSSPLLPLSSPLRHPLHCDWPTRTRTRTRPHSAVPDLRVFSSMSSVVLSTKQHAPKTARRWEVPMPPPPATSTKPTRTSCSTKERRGRATSTTAARSVLRRSRPPQQVGSRPKMQPTTTTIKPPRPPPSISTSSTSSSTWRAPGRRRQRRLLPHRRQ